jgi:hypothetical protein
MTERTNVYERPYTDEEWQERCRLWERDRQDHARESERAGFSVVILGLLFVIYLFAH